MVEHDGFHIQHIQNILGIYEFWFLVVKMFYDAGVFFILSQIYFYPAAGVDGFAKVFGY